MYLPRLFALLPAALAAAEVVYTDATSFGYMLARGEALAKRQGYTPQQRICGRGSTCQEACGPSYERCPSTDNVLHCHNPSTGTQCCTDGTGNACRAGYYCTTDGISRTTYCCPNDIQNAECARLYSLTVSLIRGTSPAVPSGTASGPLATTSRVSARTSVMHVSKTRSLPPTPTFLVPASTSLRNATVVAPSSSTSVSTTTTSTAVPSPFTGGAAKAGGAGIAALVGAAGYLL